MHQLDGKDQNWTAARSAVEYLRIAVLRFLIVQQSDHLPRGVEADVDLETGVTGAFPALCPAAVWAVHIPHDGGVHDSAAGLVRPYAVDKEHLFPLHSGLLYTGEHKLWPVITCQSKSAVWWFQGQSTSWQRGRPCWGPAVWLCPRLPSELSLSSSGPGPHILESSGRWIWKRSTLKTHLNTLKHVLYFTLMLLYLIIHPSIQRKIKSLSESGHFHYLQCRRFNYLWLFNLIFSCFSHYTCTDNEVRSSHLLPVNWQFNSVQPLHISWPFNSFLPFNWRIKRSNWHFNCCHCSHTDSHLNYLKYTHFSHLWHFNSSSTAFSTTLKMII